MPGFALAQSDSERIKELERKLDQSLRTIEELAPRVKELEASSATHSDSDTTVTRVENRDSEIGATTAAPFETPSSTASSEPAPIATPSMGFLRGFADVGASYSGNGGNKGFANGSVDLYLTPRLSEHVKSLVELVFEYDDSGQLATDLERLQIGYAFNNVATVWLGRFHTPLGYWNTAFHHGEQLQTSLLRPRLIDFEDRGGLLPVHTVGLWSTGGLRALDGRLTYDVYVGNNPSINENTLDPNNSGTTHPGLSVGFNVGYRFQNSIEGLTVGLHGYRADVRDDSVVANVSRVNMLGGYAVLDSVVWDLIAEYYAFRNEDLSGGTGHYGSWAAFVQLGRRIERWTPYVRMEKAALDQRDNYFALQDSGRSYRRGALGLRYNLTSNSTLKLEVNHTNLETILPANFNEVRMQWAIRF